MLYGGAGSAAVAASVGDAYGSYRGYQVAKRTTGILERGNSRANTAVGKGRFNQALKYLDKA